MQTVTAEWLHSIETLQDVPLAQLQWWIDNSEHYELDEEAFLFKAGEPVKGTHVIIKGRVKVFVKQKNGVNTIDI